MLWLLGAPMLVTWGPLDSLVGIGACDAQGFPSGCEDRYTVVGTIAFYVGVALLIAWILYLVQTLKRRR